uniref:Uncharacterized protein n=1 Tax=Glossina pallidipes TaxID=7398 RepID=A0A1B0ADQ9_GLOPL
MEMHLTSIYTLTNMNDVLIVTITINLELSKLRNILAKHFIFFYILTSRLYYRMPLMLRAYRHNELDVVLVNVNSEIDVTTSADQSAWHILYKVICIIKEQPEGSAFLMIQRFAVRASILRSAQLYWFLNRIEIRHNCTENIFKEMIQIAQGCRIN